MVAKVRSTRKPGKFDFADYFVLGLLLIILSLIMLYISTHGGGS